VRFADGTVWTEAQLRTLALIGTSGDDAIYGFSTDDTLDGGAGADRMTGGAGNDTYVVDNAGDVVVEQPNEGNDTVRSSVSYMLGANVENLALTGAAAINGTGNELNNALTGNSAANVLDGGAGADTLSGGAGNDTYVVDNAGDLVVEQPNEGNDTVQSSVSSALGANVENLTLTGTAAIDGTGNALNNVLTGNSAANVLTGGAGNDTYVVGAGDTVVENANEGIDTVQSSVDYTLGANLENLVLTGAALSGTGNALANTITGNASDNTLDGGAGADTLVGGAGNDSYIASEVDSIVENAGEGIDTVFATLAYPSYALAANVENLVLLSTASAVLSGNELDNTIRGNGGNDQIDGASGADTMIGGAGGDTYYVRDAGDTVIEDVNAGDDMVFSSVDFVLPDNVERLYLLGGGTAIRGTGNALDNVINGNNSGNILDGGAGADLILGGVSANTLYGGSGNDRLYGNDSSDLLDGGTGADAMNGGAGDDTYVVDDSVDVTFEFAGEGIDSVQSSISWTLAVNLENLLLTGTAAINGTGNELANLITGNSGDNVLDGGAGADTLSGGAGNDMYMVDQAGDVVVENAGDGTDTVVASVDWTLGANLENLTLAGSALNGVGNSAANTLIGNSGNNVLDGGAGADTLIGGAGNDTYWVDDVNDVVVENANEGADTVNSFISYALGSNLEALVLLGSATSGTGNELNNIIVGNDATNFLDGGAGIDTLIGGAGNDWYGVDAGDIVVEAAGGGIDVVASSVSYTLAAEVEQLVLSGSAAINGTGNELDNYLQGNDAANVLDGGAGADFLNGFGGDDTYYVDNSGDVVSEFAGGGTDTVYSSVSFVLGANVEKLVLTGSAVFGGGNSLDNAITGNAADNTLDGGAGVDTLIGGAGNDTYWVDNAGDVVIEAVGEGVDTIHSYVSFTLATDVENLTLEGSAAINGTGNALSNTIFGNSFDNTLDGGAGNDALIGGLGNDTYIVGSAGDVVTEQVGEGTDTVISSVSYTLGQNLENLTLAAGATTGTGNALDNVLVGNSSANTLNGGAGNDTLDGGTGADVMNGGTGDDVYFVDNSSDQTNENAGEGTDIVNSSVTRTLGSNLEHLVLTGTGAINGTGNSAANLIRGNSNGNTLNGAGGFDVLEGGGGNDTLSDTSGGNYLNGGSGTDSLTGGSAADFFIGGTGNDTISAGSGRDVIAFNFGDGQDSYSASSGVDNTVSLGGAGLSYEMLSFQRSGNNLILNVGASDRITFNSWYSGASNRNVLNLQVVAEAMAAFDASSSNVLLNKKVQNFDFQGLVSAFNASGQTTWALTNALLAEHLSGSDTAALGGDLAYYYGRDGSVAGIGFEKAQDVVASSVFGNQAQTIRSQQELQTGPMRLG